PVLGPLRWRRSGPAPVRSRCGDDTGCPDAREPAHLDYPVLGGLPGRRLARAGALASDPPLLLGGAEARRMGVGAPPDQGQTTRRAVPGRPEVRGEAGRGTQQAAGLQPGCCTRQYARPEGRRDPRLRGPVPRTLVVVLVVARVGETPPGDGRCPDAPEG